jgi:hypothetical protein
MPPSTQVAGIAGARLGSNQPEELARRWAMLLNCDVSSAADGWRLQMGDTELRFTDDTEGEGFVGVELHAIDPERTLSAARAAGLNVQDDMIQCLGISWRLVR